MSNNLINNNEFRYTFQSNHKIAKNYWHVKIDIISPRKYLGNKSQKSGSEETIPKLKIGKKRGRKKRKPIRDEDLDDFEIISISKLEIKHSPYWLCFTFFTQEIQLICLFKFLIILFLGKFTNLMVLSLHPTKI